MKKVSLFLIVHCSLLIANCVNAQDWKWLNPLPANGSWLSVSFPTADIGYAVGYNGMIIKSTDSGENWFLQNSGTCKDLHSVCFTDINTGYAVGKNTILQTKNGGSTWITKSDTIGDILISVSFPDANIGYAVSYLDGLILKTTDAGSTWIEISELSPPDCASAAYFTDINNGFVICDYGWILQTTNGGYNWRLLNSPVLPGITNKEVDLYSISFPDSLTGYIMGWDSNDEESILLKSSDSGNNWKIQYIDSIDPCLSYIYFTDSLTGYAFGYGTSKTSDGGKTWSLINDSTGGISCAYFFTKDSGIGVGGNFILKTLDGGIIWKNKIKFIMNDLLMNSVDFIDSLKGYIGGVSEEGDSYIYETKDGGKSWVKQTLPPNTSIEYIDFLDSLNGYAAGGGGSKAIIKTNDGGKTWTIPDSIFNHNYIESLQFVNKDTGYTIEQFNTILKTIDGAKSWIVLNNDSANELGLMSFINTKIGYVEAYDEKLKTGLILKTTNGGSSWIKLYNNNMKNGLGCIFFINNDTGYIAVNNSTLIKTTDGGIQWDSLNTGFIDGAKSLYFINAEVGYMLGGSGTIYNTINGALNWIETSCPTPMLSLCFPTVNVGYAVGGGILKTTNGGGIITGVNKPTVQNSMFDAQCYPNPVNELSVISYQLSENCMVNIKVYDFTGREITTLMNGAQDKGNYKIKLKANYYKDGMYFIKFEINNNVKVLKFLKSN